ncbi:MAG TPA: hypothetical protein ENN34_13285 [Deltaproteobacteria bacterium]|nr:hypothetical protein [Deltaproteobacteria bacterium]
MITRIISGGQTGADQAALDAAIEAGIPHGGWIPLGRKTEDGPLSETYRLRELPSAEYPARTEQNVIDSDGTLIISRGELTGGSDYTRRMAVRHRKPWIHIDADTTSVDGAAAHIRAWVREHRIRVLNVAGPRASADPDIYAKTKTILRSFLHPCQENFRTDHSRKNPEGA